MKNALLLVLLLIVIFVGMAIVSETETETETYAIGNDGGYVPTYKVNCTAQRIADTVEVIWNGNAYSAYVSPESEIQTGDEVRCTFIIYEGNVELVDIK